VNEAQFVCACATARQVARVLTQFYDSVLRESGLEAPQFVLLLTLEKLGPSNQAALGRLFGLGKTTVSRNVQWLERQGWIATTPGRTRRERQLTLTTEGRRRLSVAKPRWKQAQECLRAEMTEKEWAAMFRVFQTVTEAAHHARQRRSEVG
jgi:DNA-binding MarR family transcriptional regulator